MSEPTQEQEMDIIRMTIEDAKEKIALGDALIKLSNNEYFKTVIFDKYLKDYPINLVMMKASPTALRSEDMTRHICAQIDGIGHFKQFLMAIQAEADMARKALADSEDELQEMHRQENEGA
jgi:hypothetical protein